MSNSAAASPNSSVLLEAELISAILRRREETAKLTASLTDFVKAAWPLIEPATPLEWNWHHQAIAEHLQAVTEGKIKKLLINICPRSGKSSLVSVLWPAWVWACKPSTRMMFASYAQNLSWRDSYRRRHVLESDWFRKHWSLEFASDRNLVNEFENKNMGYMIATSVGGSVLGRGGDILVIDDPHQPDEALSDKMRQNVLDWYDLAWATRLNHPKESAMVIIMQRLHESDLSAHVLAQGGWELLSIPMEYEP